MNPMLVPYIVLRVALAQQQTTPPFDYGMLIPIIVGLIVLVVALGAVIAAFILGHDRGTKNALHVMDQLNSSKALLDAIEMAGKNVPASTVEQIMATLSLIGSVAPLPEQKQLVDEAKKFIQQTTDGKPNDPPAAPPPPPLATAPFPLPSA
jgi:hypothetical protein